MEHEEIKINDTITIDIIDGEKALRITGTNTDYRLGEKTAKKLIEGCKKYCDCDLKEHIISKGH